MLTFDEILAGAAGPKEAAAAKRWLDAGAPVQPLPSRLVALDPHGFDMRVAGGHARKRLPAVDLLPDSPAEGTAAGHGGVAWLPWHAGSIQLRQLLVSVTLLSVTSPMPEQAQEPARLPTSL